MGCAVGGARHSALRGQSGRQFGDVRQYFVDCLELGRSRGEIRPEVVPAEVAQLLVELI
jgi:hypothetical protein